MRCKKMRYAISIEYFFTTHFLTSSEKLDIIYRHCILYVP